MKRIFLICGSVVFLAACNRHDSTKPVAQPPNSIDRELRAFLGINTLDATVRLPDFANAYYAVAVMFSDGKEIAHGKGPLFSIGPRIQRSPITNIQLLWQVEASNFRRAALVNNGNISNLSDSYPDWQHLVAGGQSSRPVSEDENLTYKGISVRGILIGSSTGQLYPTSETLLSAAKHLVIIGFVFGSDIESVKQRFQSPEL